MPEWRKLYRNISDSKKLSRLKSDSPRLLWTWMIPYTDCEGRLIADPAHVKGKVLSRLDDWTSKKVETCLKELDKVELIQLYEVNNELYAQFDKDNFEEFQKPRRDREAESRIPTAPPRELPTNSRPTPDLLQHKSAELHDRLDKSRLDKSRVEESPADVPPLTPEPFTELKRLTIERWNEFAAAHGLKGLISIAVGSQREKHFRARLLEETFDLTKILETAGNQEFCFGKNDRGWKISFDWIIKNTGNYVYILEEKYLNDDQKRREFKFEESDNEPY